MFGGTAAPPTPYQALRAACLAGGGFGVVSHASAAWVWKLIPQPPDTSELTVLTGTRQVRPRPGLTIHRSRDLDITTAVNRNLILVTNPMRTLVDFASIALPRDLTEAVDNALATRLINMAAIQAEIARLARHGRPGVGMLRRHLVERGFIGAPEPSVLEAHLRRLVVSLHLPFPIPELHVGEEGEYRLDIAWQEIMLAVEVDGYAWHSSPEHKQRDQDRRNRLQRMGWTVLVYDWRAVVREPTRMGVEISSTYHQLVRAGAHGR